MKKLIVALLSLSLLSIASPAVADDTPASIGGRVHVNDVEASGELGLVAVRLVDSAGTLVLGEGVEHGTFLASNIPPGDYTLSFGNYDPVPFIDWVNYPITLLPGEKRTNLVISLWSKPGVPLVSYVDGVIDPGTVTWGRKVKVYATMRSYGSTVGGTVQLLHHGETVQSKKVKSGNQAVFTLDSDEWGNKKGTHRYKVKLTFTGKGDVKRAVDYPTFRIR